MTTTPTPPLRPHRDRAAQVEFLRSTMLSMVRAMVEHEELVHVAEHVMTGKVIWEVFVAESDAGIAIGAGGSHVHALRTVLNIACKKTGFKVDLTITSHERRRIDE